MLPSFCLNKAMRGSLIAHMPTVMALEEWSWLPVLPLIPHVPVFPASCFWQHELLDRGLGYGWFTEMEKSSSLKDEKAM